MSYRIMQTHGVKQCTDKCGAVTTQGGAWLQSDNFGWVGLDSLMDRRKSVGTEDGGGIGDDDIGA